MSTKVTFPSLCLLGFLLASLPLKAADPTMTPVPIDTVGNTQYGYYEYLPAAYYENPDQDFPIVIFFHGRGERGDGSSSTLSRVTGNGPFALIKSSSHPLRNIFNDNDMIVLAPQQNGNGWWGDYELRRFLDYALANYRIDPRRIYFTGLSAGSSGIHEFMNNDPGADQVTAYVVCALRGKVDAGIGDYLGTRTPYWALVEVDASANERGLAEEGAANMAAFLSGVTPPDIRTGYPGKTSTNSVYYDIAAGDWVWESGTPLNADRNIRVTLFPGDSHNSWTDTYNTENMWLWMFAQEKPTVTITSPEDELLVPQGTTVSLQATAVDAADAPIAGSELLWSSDIDGDLGSGTSLELDDLSIGIHTISCTTTDSLYRIGSSSVTVNVVAASAYTAQIDFGYSSYLTELPGWNNIYNYQVGKSGTVVENLVSSMGVSTGVRVELVDSFWTTQAGVVDSTLYPETAQRDALAVSDANDGYGAFQFSGLNPSQTYNFTIFASRSSTGSRTALYTVNGGKTATLYASQNTSNTASITEVSPDAEGKILFEVTPIDSSNLGYLGVIILEANAPPTSNAAPVVNAGSNRNVALDDDSTAAVVLGGSVTDDGLTPSVSIAWSVVSSPHSVPVDFADETDPETTVTVNRPGTYVLQLSADDGELVSTDTVELTAFYPPEPFRGWWQDRFNETQRGNPAVSGPDADPDGDGVPNLAEYSLGTNPWKGDRPSILPMVDGARSGIRFQRDPSLIDVTYQICKSDSLAADDWTVIATSVDGENFDAAYPGTFSISESGHDPLTVTVLEGDDFDAASGPRFFKIIVTTSTELTE